MLSIKYTPSNGGERTEVAAIYDADARVLHNPRLNSHVRRLCASVNAMLNRVGRHCTVEYDLSLDGRPNVREVRLVYRDGTTSRFNLYNNSACRAFAAKVNDLLMSR